MLIIGAKGLAKEILEIIKDLDGLSNLVFYDDININDSSVLFEKFVILKNEASAVEHFKTIDKRFLLGLGNPTLRREMCVKFKTLGGNLASAISPNAKIGSFGVEIGNGSIILESAVISNDVKIGQGCLIYYNVIITHDTEIGDYVEISPSAVLLGRCKIGNHVQIGSHATILPDVVVGNNAIIAAGAVITQNVPQNCMVAGVPGVIKKNF